MVETIFTKHPQKGRSGQEISKEKYDAVRFAITECLTLQSPLTLKELTEAVKERLSKTPFPGSIAWYVKTVLLDLEARKVVEATKDGTQETFRMWPDLQI